MRGLVLTLLVSGIIAAAPVAPTSPSSMWAIRSRFGPCTTTTGHIDSVAFVDRLHGTAVGQNSSVYTTADGGRTWAYRAYLGQGGLSDAPEFTRVHFYDHSRGVVFDLIQEEALATDDGGRTWHHVPATWTRFGFEPASTALLGPHLWLAIGTLPSRTRYRGLTGLFRSTDAGRSWRYVGPTPTMGRLTFVTPRVGWLADAKGVYRTTDGGKVWRLVFRQAVDDASFPSATVGYASIRDRLLRTGDSGATWTETGLAATITRTESTTHINVGPIGGALVGGRSIAAPLFVSDARGMVIVGYREVYLTIGAGKTWTYMPLPADDNDPYINSVGYRDGGPFVVTGSNSCTGSYLSEAP